MKYISEEVAYLRGLAEGLEIESETKEGKMICKIIDVLENIADTLDDMQDDYDELAEYVESVDEDLSDIEDIIYEEDDDEDELLSPHPTNAVAEIARVATSANVLFNLFIGSFPP